MGTIKADSIQPTIAGNNLILRTGSDVERVRISPTGDINVSGNFVVSVTGNAGFVGNVGVTGNITTSGTVSASGKITSASTTGSDSATTVTTKDYHDLFSPVVIASFRANGVVHKARYCGWTGSGITVTNNGDGTWFVDFPSGMFTNDFYTPMISLGGSNGAGSAAGPTGIYGDGGWDIMGVARTVSNTRIKIYIAYAGGSSTGLASSYGGPIHLLVYR